MNLRVRLYARARDMLKTDAVEITLPDGATVGALRQQLRISYPQLGSLLETAAFAVDDEYGTEDQPLTASAEVAFLPPVSGGT